MHINACPAVPGVELVRYANYALHFGRAHAGIAPTHWQASLFPEPFASRIGVIHDGIRTDQSGPTACIRVQTPHDVLQLGSDDEVITFVNRNLEPYRDYHQFIRALPALPKARPKARVVIIGGTRSATALHPHGQPTSRSIAGDSKLLGSLAHRQTICADYAAQFTQCSHINHSCTLLPKK